jgi:hypothetical protein
MPGYFHFCALAPPKTATKHLRHSQPFVGVTNSDFSAQGGRDLDQIIL